MNKKIFVLLASLLLTRTQLYAGNGDLIVNGNVGVGTVTPNTRLHVYGADTNRTLGGNTNAAITIQNTDTGSLGTQEELLFLHGAESTKVAGITALYTTYASGTGAGALLFNTRDNTDEITTLKERMRIDKTGKVGIGTVSPNARLHVYGADTNRTLGGNTNAAITIQNTDTGSLGTQEELLFLHGAESTKIAGITALYTTYASGTGAGALLFNTRDNTDAITTLKERMRIDKNGNVGIGTTNPAYKLDVQGLVASNGQTLTSDARFKKNLLPIESSLSKILRLEGVSYEWKIEEYKDKGFPKGRHYGVIAQEVEKVLPEVVNEGSDGSKSVAYTEIIPVLIEAIKEQQKEIEQLKKKLADMQQ